MLAFKPAILFLLSSLTLASPVLEPRTGCLTDKQATFLTNIMVSISVKFDPAYVTKYIADDFFVQSDSINFLSGVLQPGQITANKTTFLASNYNLTTTTKQPAINVIDMFHNCDEIAFRWEAMDKPYGLRGIDIMKIKPGMMLIERDFSEFNTGVLLVDAGLFPCKS